MWMRGGSVPVGGAMTIPLKAMGIPPHWRCMSDGRMLEETVAHVERLGGGALSPVIDVPAIGRHARDEAIRRAPILRSISR